MSSGINQEPRKDSEQSAGRLDRITDQTRGLVDDVKEWVDLRIRLVQMDLEEKFETAANQAVLALVLAGIGATSIFFALVAAAFGLGQLLGHTAFGFLAVSVVLAILMWLVHWRRPRLIKTALLLPAQRQTDTTGRQSTQEGLTAGKEPAVQLARSTQKKEIDTHDGA